MAMALADGGCFRAALDEYDDVLVHRLLPREILADVGIDDGGATVDELAARLVGILGLDGAGRQQRAIAPPPAAAPLCARRDLCRSGNGLVWAGAAPRDAQAASLPRFQPPPPPLSFFATEHPPLARIGGTGVFLPRAEAYLPPPPQSRAAAASVAKPPRIMRKEQEAAMAAAAAMAREQHLIQLQLRAMAAEMAALRGWPPAALAPPQPWTY